MSLDFQLARMGIYTITNSVNGRVYVGQSRRVAGRWRDHKIELCAGRGSPRLQFDWDLFTAECFKFDIVEVVADPCLLQTREQYHMDTLGACSERGYNTLPTAGSFKGYTPNAEARRKIGEHSRKRLTDPVVQEKMKAGQAARGYQPTAEHRAKVSAAQKGIPRGPLSELHRKNISGAKKGKAPLAAILARTGVAHTEETKRKMSAAKKGHFTEAMQIAAAKRRGGVASDEHKANMSAARKGVPWTLARREAHERGKVLPNE